MNQFKVGDVIKLKSGGPSMSVFEVKSDGRYSVAWFFAPYDKVNTAAFSGDQLEMVKEANAS